MKTFLKTAGALCALTVMGTTAAKADYVIMQDTSFPSVVYFEFDEPVAQEPAIITVPQQTQSPVGGVFPPAPAPAPADEPMAAADPIVMTPSSNGQIETSGPISFNERLVENADKSPDQIAQERAQQFDQLSGSQLEQAAEDAIVEDAIFSDVGLR
ncbi:MAG: hypothetical protein WA921_09145 [Ahrensia sp.]